MSNTITIPNQVHQKPPDQAIAPVWHTILVVAVILGVSALGAYAQKAGTGLTHTANPHVRSILYLRAVLGEWLVAAFLWYGTWRQGVRFRTLLGEKWAQPYTVFRNLGIAFLFLIGSNVVLAVLRQIVHTVQSQSLRNLLSQSRHDVPYYLLLALSAGICEEIIFRGYFQAQFLAWTKNSTAALTIQAFISGAAHGYQGFKHMLIIGVFGWLFGLLALWRRSLLPGMMAHAMQDGVLGLVVRHTLK